MHDLAGSHTCPLPSNQYSNRRSRCCPLTLSRPHVCICRPGTEPPSKFNAWYLKCPEWVLQLLMPYLATARVRKLYYKGTLQSKPKLIRDEWWAWARNAPWVVQALMVQVKTGY